MKILRTATHKTMMISSCLNTDIQKLNFCLQFNQEYVFFFTYARNESDKYMYWKVLITWVSPLFSNFEYNAAMKSVFMF